MSGWNLVDPNTNKSLPSHGTSSLGVSSPFSVAAPSSTDPVGKLRVSQPTALIDTDFEYGPQPTKWESIGLANNRQSLYYIPQAVRVVTTVTGNGTRTVVVNMADTTGFIVGTPVYVQNSNAPDANGWYYVQAVATNVSITYTAQGIVPAGNQFNTERTYVYLGFIYSNCGIRLAATTAFTYVNSTTTVTTGSAHGLSAGSLIYLTGVTSTQMSATLGWISGTVMSLNAVPSAGLVLRVGYSVTGVGVTANTTITAVNASTFNGTISGTTLTYNSGTIPVIGMQLSGVGVTAGTYIESGTSPTFTVSESSTVTAISIIGYNYTVSASQTVGAIGTPVALSSTSTLVANTPNGAWVVATTPTANTATFATFNTPFGTLSNVANNLTLFARTSGAVESRPFDGGVAFSAGAGVPNAQLIRQTRRYFRYQSGKGIQFSTGSSLKPLLLTTSITAVGTTATVTTRYNHNMAVGSTIIVSGCEQIAYNGTFSVASTPTPTSLTYVMNSTPTALIATGFPIRVSPNTWYGSSNRIGFFDQQNGLFFEYDGQTLYAVWRNSVLQLNGVVNTTQNLSAVTGVGTQFSSQLKPGDFVVIRGQSYRILTITSDTAMEITPEYKGTTVVGTIMSKTVDTRVPQSQWADPLDGTGSSGYRIDLTRMQMFYIDYSWYGAGFSRFGLRTSRGQITYVHQFTNNNVQYEAYMRSGNMAAHYESNGINPTTYLTSSLTTGAAGTIVNVNSTAGFAPSGVLRISNPGTTGTVEQISYSSKTDRTFVVLARAQIGGNTVAQAFTYSATAPTLVEFASPDTLASLAHWGSSVIMDGGFDDDKSLVFNYGMTSPITTTSTAPRVLMALRVAPSVDNNVTGVLGARETINRMQLQLESLGLYTTGTGYLLNLVLNGFSSGTFSGQFVAPVQQVGGITSSLAQIALNTAAITVTGGESVFAGYTNPTGVTRLDLSGVRDLGNSILGGGTTNLVPTTQSNFYPDGPDILYVVAIPLAATSSTIVARLGWQEAQA